VSAEPPRRWRALQRSEAAAGLDLEEAWPRVLEGAERMKEEPGTLLLREAGEPARWWKLYFERGAQRALSPLARPRALREWRALRAAAARGLPAAPALLCAEARHGPWREASLLVTGEVSGARDLRRLLAPHPPGDPARRPWIEAAGRAARAFHEAGLGHFRMQLRNLLARSPGEGVVWLDLPYACVFPGPAPRSVRLLDLVDLAGADSALDAGETTLLLRAYAGGEAPPADAGTLRGRGPGLQKLHRIGLYLLYQNTGCRP